MEITKHRLLWWIVGIVLVAALSYASGRISGKMAGERDKERLQQLWPGIMTMPEQDRARIVRAAMECKLSSKPLQVDAVAQCLRDGAESMRSDDVLGAERVLQLLAQVGR